MARTTSSDSGTLLPPEKAKKSSGSKVHPISWPDRSTNVDQMADLRRKLEKVMREEDEQGTSVWESLTARLRTRNIDIEEEREQEQPLSLCKRYDFQESSKVKWNAPQDLPKVNVPASAASIPFPSSATANHKVEPCKHARGSPRVAELEHSPKFFINPTKGDPWHPQTHHQRSHSHSLSATRRRVLRFVVRGCHRTGAASHSALWSGRAAGCGFYPNKCCPWCAGGDPLRDGEQQLDRVCIVLADFHCRGYGPLIRRRLLGGSVQLVPHGLQPHLDPCRGCAPYPTGVGRQPASEQQELLQHAQHHERLNA